MNLLPWLLLAWILGIVCAVAWRIIANRVTLAHERRMQRPIRNAEAVRLADLVKRRHEALTPLERRRMLREFNRSHAAKS